ncbi:MAG: glycosyltransferase family 4 protein [Thermoflexibacter sp.]|nr:glycosyltransferase family 4 protein [Thermoflexibacter sp.]
MTESKTILIISPNYPPEQGACASRIRYMAQGLSKAGYQVEVLTAMPNYPKGKIFEKYTHYFTHKEFDNQVLVKQFPIYPSNSSRLFPRFWSMLSISLSIFLDVFTRRKNKPSLIIAQSPPLLLAWSAYCLSKLYRTDFVLNISDLWPQALVDLGAIRKGILTNIAYKIERFLYRRSKFCIGQSQEIIDYIGKICPHTPTLLYRTGVDTLLFSPAPIIPQVDNRPFRIVYAGLLGIAQGILSICKNLNFNKLNAELHIYGDGVERDLLKKYLSANPHVGIYLHDPVPQAEVPTILQGYDCALIAQKAIVLGTVPSKIYEAMSVGLPILFCGGGEGAAIVEQNQIGLVCLPNNIEMLENNILKLKDIDIKQRQEIKEKGRAIAKAEYDRTKLMENLLASFSKLF